MAELHLMVRDSGTKADGDILLAHNDAEIRLEHAFLQCLPRKDGRLVGMDGNGILSAEHLAFDFESATRSLVIERVSKTEAIVRRLSDGAELRIEDGVMFENTLADGTAGVIHFEPFFLRRRFAQRFPVYGSVGREVVFGGRHDLSEQAVLQVWGKIDRKTGRKHTDRQFRLKSKGDQDLKSFLCIPVEDFDNDEKADIEADDADDVEQERKRKSKRSNWRAFLSDLKRSIRDIQNSDIRIDIREEVPPIDHPELIIDKKSGKKRRLKRKNKS